MKKAWVLSLAVAFTLLLWVLEDQRYVAAQSENQNESAVDRQSVVDRTIDNGALRSLAIGRRIFRFDTFGDEAFWGDTLKLHRAIEGAAFGGVGPGISPRAALNLGLKVDVDAVDGFNGRLQSGHLDLDSPAGTLALLQANAVVGLTGFFNKDGSLK